MLRWSGEHSCIGHKRPAQILRRIAVAAISGRHRAHRGRKHRPIFQPLKPPAQRTPSPRCAQRARFGVKICCNQFNMPVSVVSTSIRRCGDPHFCIIHQLPKLGRLRKTGQRPIFETIARQAGRERFAKRGGRCLNARCLGLLSPRLAAHLPIDVGQFLCDRVQPLRFPEPQRFPLQRDLHRIVVLRLGRKIPRVIEIVPAQQRGNRRCLPHRRAPDAENESPSDSPRPPLAAVAAGQAACPELFHTLPRLLSVCTSFG